MKGKIVMHEYFGEKLILKRKNKKYLNLALLFPKTRYNQPFQFRLNRKKMLVYYEYKHSHSLIPIQIPQKLEINKELLVGLGIYMAEGAKNRHPKITNSEPRVMHKAIDFFNLFGFNNKNFKAWVQLHERSLKTKEKALEYWLKNTSLKRKNITTVRTKESTGNAKVKQHGTLHLEIYSTLFRLLIKSLLDNIKNILAECDNKQIIWFLQGAYAGEGTVGRNKKTKSVNLIGYTSTNRKEREIIRTLLQRLKIKMNKNKESEEIRSFGYFNLKKWYEINIFKYHSIRKKSLEEGFNILIHNQIPGVNKKRILDLVKMNKNINSQTIAKRLNLSYFNVAKHLNELYKLKRIKKIPGSGSIRNKWFI